MSTTGHEQGRTETVIDEAVRRTGLDRETIWLACDAMSGVDLTSYLDRGFEARRELLLAVAIEAIQARGYVLTCQNPDGSDG